MLNIPLHLPMRNTGVDEGLADRVESRTFIETDRVGLGGQRHTWKSLLNRQIQQHLKQGPSDSTPAPILEDGHSADPAVRAHTRRTDGVTAFVEGQHMGTI